MSTNLSKLHREDLLDKIQQIRNHIAAAPQDTNTGNLLQYLDELTKEVNGMKYGLVFEEHHESIDEILETHTPVLTEQNDLFINNGGEINFLIEGDNLAALKLLEKTHKGKIDVIYIDPPYNTGKEDFTYDDVYVDVNDTFRHSKWLSFMEKRLQIARNLLSKNGVIFISIDDHEQCNLKLLCDRIFDDESFINNFMWLHGKGKKNKQSRTLQQYVLAYGKTNRDNLPEWTSIREAKGTFANPDDDPRGEWFSGSISFSEERSNKNHSNYFTIESPSGIKWTRQWMCTQEEMTDYLNENKIYFGNAPKYENTPRIKIFPTDTNEIIPDNILPNVGTTRSAQTELNKIIGTKTNDKGKTVPKFDNPKPHELIEHLVKICNDSNCITILDFFAGSGTTGHAVMKLNVEDKKDGHRKFILCTNNENNICRDVTYERLKTVITGKRKDGSNYNEHYNASLKYYKIDFVPIGDKLYYEYADQLLLHIRELVELENGISFNGNNKIAIVLTDEEMEQFVAKTENPAKVLYRGHDVLLSAEQEEYLKAKGIQANVIPDYYYNELNR
jgi:adenine-specific DNA-methyltransferase